MENVQSADMYGEGDFVMDSTTVRLICGVLAVLFGMVIFMRRRRKAD